MIKAIFFIIVIFLALVVGSIFFFTPTKVTTIKDADFTEGAEYLCAEGKSFSTAFGGSVVRLSFSDKRVFTLEKVSTDDESGTKYANEGNQMVFWVRDDSAFIEEMGTTTFGSCRISQN